ncbi:MAG: TetR/AcrR family transcriptional regulator [Salibacteraceae bacterium]
MTKGSLNKMSVAKEKIILSAESLFSQQGYESTSVNTIISNAQVSKGAFYHHFKTKEDLILAIIEFEHEKNAVIPPSIDSSATPSEIFKAEISRWFDSINNTKHLLPWMVPLMAHPVLKNKFQEMEPESQRVKDYLTELLRGISCKNPEQESAILYYFFAGLKMELSIYPKTDITPHKEIILNKYLKTN